MTMFGFGGWTPRFALVPGALGQSVTVEQDGRVLGVGRDRGHAVRILLGDLVANSDRYDGWAVDDRTPEAIAA